MRGPSHRGARIRTGDLCDPNAALYRTEPRPGLHISFSQSNGRSGIGLTSFGRSRFAFGSARPEPTLHPPSEAARVLIPEPPCSAINGRSGIRTHAGLRPHDFQSCALSHSAIRPGIAAPRRDPRVGSCSPKTTCSAFGGGSGMELASLGRLASGSARTHAPSSLERCRGSSSQHHPDLPLTEGVGFEPTRAFWTQRLSRAPP